MDCDEGLHCLAETNESFWDFKGSLETVDSWPMMSSPWCMASITAVYLLFVLKVGPDFMKKRQPYRLKNLIVLYNLLQVGVSLYIGYLASKFSWPHGWISKTCLIETEDTRDTLTTIMYYYHLAKISEVLDTVFFILRKKYSQVSFLHVYHHAMMIVASWGVLKYEPTYPTLFLRNINSFVHVIMYGYYALSSFPSLAKYLWWKKYITKLQLVQFTLVLIHFTLTFIFSECKPSFPLSLTVFWNTTFFMYLFGKFYFNTYQKKKANNIKIHGNIEKKSEDTKRSYVNDNDTKRSYNNDNGTNTVIRDNLLINRKNMMNGN